VINRREFLKVGSVAIGGSVVLPAATYAVGIEPTWIETREVPLGLPQLDPRLAGLRVLQLSDIHRSDQVSAEYLESAIEMAAATQPELVLLTGDFITHDRKLFRDVAQRLAPLARIAPSFAVPGNHDYDHWYRWSQPGMPQGAELLGEELAKHNITLLRNRSIELAPRGSDARLQLVGLDDVWSSHFAPERAFDRPVSPNVTRIVLCHNPDGYRLVEQQPFDLMVCGHTHGGQVHLPWIGVPYRCVEDARFIAGLVQVPPHQVYVNRGLGWNRRIRWGVRPEISRLTLHPADTTSHPAG
jgi:hypothetical protein